ncbi:hypothetical protein KFE94_14215 [bacterium SCSIO 12643]|nr:hypothetical protein KFE94_14215 [bacterium SCSIO 12643]
MKSKIVIGLIVMLTTLVQVSWAQPPGGPHGEKKEKIMAMKVEFITSKLDLTVEEAQKFWPVYNEFVAKMDALEQKRRQMRRQNRGKELTDAEINKLIEFNFDIEQEILDLKREYDKKFKQVIPVQKVGKLYQAEHEFKREILKRLKRGGPPPR